MEKYPDLYEIAKSQVKVGIKKCNINLYKQQTILTV